MLNEGDIVGHFILTEDEVFVQHYEYAGAETEIAVKAGRYPVIYKYPTYNYCMFSVELPGIIKRDFFQNRLGAATSVADTSANIGKPRSYHISWSPFDLPRTSQVTLLDSIVVDTVGEYSSGTPMQKINLAGSVGLDPSVAQASPEINPYPGSEYLKRFND